MYGIITESNLSGGIIEERDDDTYIVVSFTSQNLLAYARAYFLSLQWRTFRHTPTKLTPFGMWAEKNKNIHSDSPRTIYTKKEYNDLLQASCGVDPDTITITARPLTPLQSPQDHDLTPLHIHIQCPMVFSSEAKEVSLFFYHHFKIISFINISIII